MTSVLAIIVASVSFRLPDFKPLPRDFNAAFTQVFDLLGISVCLEQNLVPGQFFLRPVSADDLKRIYMPQHVALSIKDGDPDRLQDSRLRSVPDLTDRWRNAVLAHPGCYLRHRLAVLSYLVGANADYIFLPTFPELAQNEFGITMARTPLTERVVDYVLKASWPTRGLSNLLARGWFWWAAATIAALLLLLRRRPLWRLAALTYLSGLLYILSAVAVVPAADARNAHWLVVACFIVVALFVLDLAESLLRRWSSLKPQAAHSSPE
jgi:hypothetical protein